MSTSISLSPRGHLRATVAIACVWDNYVISNKITLVNTEGKVAPKPISDASKSKLATCSTRIPIFLELDISRNSFISAGIYGEHASAWTKYKFPKTRSYDIESSINSFRWGALAKIGLTEGFYLYGDYSFTPLFRTDRGPVTYPMSIGMGCLF